MGCETYNSRRCETYINIWGVKRIIVEGVCVKRIIVEGVKHILI